MASEANQLQQSQLAMVLGSDSALFEILISHLISAEALFNLAKQSNPDTLALKLSHLLQLSPHPEASAMAAVLLPKLLTRDDAYLRPHLSLSTQSSLKSSMMSCIQHEGSGSSR